MRKFIQNKYFLLIIISITWGSSFILIKKSLPVFDPYQIGAFRAGLSGLILSFIGLPALMKMSKKDIFWISLSGLFGNFLVVFIFPIAQEHVSSSLAGIINALDPIFTLIIGALLFGIRNRMTQYAGAIIGFIGAVVLVYSSDSGNGGNHLYYTLLLAIGSALYAVAALIIEKKLSHIKSTDISTGIYTIWMLPSLLILGFSGFFTEIDYTQNETLTALGYLIFLTVISTTLVMFLFFKLVQDTSAVFVSSISLLIPVVSVIWGVLDHEQFTIWYIVGGTLILVSVYLIRDKKIPENSIESVKKL